jgi:hypothetical protein
VFDLGLILFSFKFVLLDLGNSLVSFYFTLLASNLSLLELLIGLSCFVLDCFMCFSK